MSQWTVQSTKSWSSLFWLYPLLRHNFLLQALPGSLVIIVEFSRNEFMSEVSGSASTGQLIVLSEGCPQDGTVHDGDCRGSGIQSFEKPNV